MDDAARVMRVKPVDRLCRADEAVLGLERLDDADAVGDGDLLAAIEEREVRMDVRLELLVRERLDLAYRLPVAASRRIARREVLLAELHCLLQLDRFALRERGKHERRGKQHHGADKQAAVHE